jgi:carbonic anhydrase
MCFECVTQGMKRRNFLKLAGVGVAAGLVGMPGSGSVARASEGEWAVTPDEALAKLKAGNEAFVKDAEACTAGLAKRRTELMAGQHPWATVLTCSDSRVSPELIFGGVTLGELFVARNAGNVVDSDVLGTLEYGAEHLHAPLIVVMGHKKCGAVGAACDVVTKGAHLEGSIGKMIQPILPVALEIGATDKDLVDKTIHANAINGAKRIEDESPMIAELVESGKVKVVAAYYDLESGKVEFLEAA